MAGIFSPNIFSRGVFSCLWPFASLDVQLAFVSAASFELEVTEMPTLINRGDTKTVVFQLKAGDDVLTLADITTLVLTLRDVKTVGVINSRTSQNIKNANNVTVDTDGTVTWEPQALDNVVVDGRLKTETHRALVRCTYDGGRVGSGEFDIVVTNTERLP